MGNETIGLLYPGEMGTAIGTLLAEREHSIVTTLRGRSAATCDRCERAGFETVDSLGEVFERATMIWSFVHPGKALALAEECVSILDRVGRTDDPGNRKIYIDGNSIAPTTAGKIARRFESARVAFVDASIHGDSDRLRERSVLYLSGDQSTRVAESFGAAMRIRLLGTDPTAASRFKMTIAGISKGASALLMEVATFASQQGVLEAWLEDCRHFYPELMGTLKTMLPTYARHAGRRAAELEDMIKTMREAGAHPRLLAGAQQLVKRLASPEVDATLESVKQPGTTLDAFLAALGTSLGSTEPTDTSSPTTSTSTIREETNDGSPKP